MKRIWISIFVVLLLAACGNSTDADSNGNGDVETIKVAYVQSTKPMSYTDENGEPAGYDVEVLQEVEKRLDGYEFEFIGTSDDDLLIGVEQGKFDIGVKNAFYTEERTKKFLYPEQFIGLSSIGLVLKDEDKDIESLVEFAEADYDLAPIAANNAQYTVIEKHNEENPDLPVNLKAGDEFSLDVIQWVLEDRVDGGVIIEGVYNSQVLDEAGPYHHLKDDIVYNEFDVIETWPLFNKEQEELAEAFDEAMEEVHEEEIPRELSEKYYGKDLFELRD